jgi:hypothetical protein
MTLLLRFNVVLFVPSVDGLFVYVSENIFAEESVRCPFLGEYRTIAYHLRSVNRCYNIVVEISDPEAVVPLSVIEVQDGIVVDGILGIV